MAIVPYRIVLPVVSQSDFTPWGINLISRCFFEGFGGKFLQRVYLRLSDKLLHEITISFRLSLSPMFKLINRLSHFDTHEQGKSN